MGAQQLAVQMPRKLEPQGSEKIDQEDGVKDEGYGEDEEKEKKTKAGERVVMDRSNEGLKRGCDS